MRIDIVSLLPELIRSPFEASILKRAQSKGLAEVHLHDLREFGLGKHKQVDDYAFGGGAGMVWDYLPKPMAAVKTFVMTAIASGEYVRPIWMHVRARWIFVWANRSLPGAEPTA